jgi:hypothetical protein
VSEFQTASFLAIYCERTQFGLWAEPFNLLTNLAFIAAAVAAGKVLFERSWFHFKTDWDLIFLVGCLFAIGLGSALWHAYAMPWAALADVIPITLFINGFFLSFLVRIGHCDGWQALLFFIGFQMVNVSFARLFPGDTLNGSIMYLPAYTALLGCTGHLLVKHHPAARAFFIASMIFLVSLTFRTVDNNLCRAFPVGTHFLWHLLNAFMLYLLLAALIKTTRVN